MISIDFRSGQPLYRQVKDGIKRLILCGAVSESEKLPSVRELAAQLAINPNTIARAYRELEADGYIGTSPGKGVFVAGCEVLRQRRIDELYDGIVAEFRKLLELGFTPQDVLTEIKNRLGV